MNKYQLVKEHIFSVNDMDYVGICKASVLEGEPAGHRPSDLLPNAKSIIVFARRLIDGSVQGKFRHIEDKCALGFATYQAFSVLLAINQLCMSETYDIAQWLEKDFNAYAMPLTNNVTQAIEVEGNYLPYFADPYKAGLPIDLYKAAVAAGLGEMTWSHRVATPDNGPRIYICGIVTDIEFEEYDTPYAGEKLCDPEKCHICSEVCPTHALEAGKGYEVEIAGRTYRIGELDANGCAVACFGFRKELNARAKAVVEQDHPTDEQLAEALKKQFANPGPMNLDHVQFYHCDRCLVYCPIGNWSERYRDNGLTKK